MARQIYTLRPPALLVLAALGGRTAREIGELDGIPVGTAKTRIRTALIRVRDDLATDEASRG